MEWQKYMQSIKNGWWIIVLSALSALSLALIYSYYTTPLYRAEARLVVSPGAKILAAQEQTVVNSLLALDRRSIAATYAEILISDRIFYETADDLNIDLSDLEMYSRSAVALPEANVLEFTIEGPDPEIVTLVANTVSQKAIQYISELYVIFDISLLDPATIPIQPFKPTPIRDALVATFLGGVFGIVLAILRGQLHEYLSISSLIHLLRTDNQSSAYSRRHFINRLEEELKRNQTDALAIGLLQLVGLQNIISSMPPLVRQQLLRRIVKIIKNELRNNDVVARWGDTSFSILFPAASEVAATRTMDSIKGALMLPLEILETGEQILLKPQTTMIPTLGINKPGEIISSIDKHDTARIYKRRIDDQ